MQFAASLVPGRLVQRYKRFLADIDTDDGRVTVHCPNPGAMLGLNTPGARVLLSRSSNPARKLPLTWELVEADLPGGAQWVGINTMRPNALVAEAFRAGAIAALDGHDALRPEVRYAAASRVDFLASGAATGPCHVEVKNCHLMRRAGLAEFPDCKAARSARHMRDLAQVVAEGGRALVVIVVQLRAEAFDVARDIDPAFDRAFREARAAGVAVRAYRCAVAPEGVAIAEEIPVITPA
ncbi:sugar fermentation stimulation protein [Methylobacterium sp. Leaf361]|uniref:DNA/RNA nuclease SfsA n=1 Tax=Methylobacterium sp. Leaf361 TaxID=1736352 RepID=UPI0006F97A5D|nr:DNA/RNA nuclease SfsA [Methylobacterium sp. Leaf361]KQS81763.1 sugar fermentation stimulation protein [Methylobacterium sp. Leaf361]